MAAQSPDLVQAVMVAAPAAQADRPPAAWRRLGTTFWLSGAWLALVTMTAVLAPLLHLADPNFQDLANRGGAASAAHLLGTDGLGRDMLSRLVWGARISLTVGYASTILGMVLGTLLGMAAGYIRGPSEAVLAARAMGAGELRILALEILPNIVAPVLTFGLLAVAVAMIAEGALAFLGLSVPPPNASWGAMIAEGRGDLDTWPQTSLIPAAVFFLTIFALNLAADRMRRAVELRASRL